MTQTNKLSKKGAAFVRMHEGFISRWYLDPIGVPTIGVGFTWRSDSFRAWWARNKRGVEFKRGATMTRVEADDALQYLVTNEYGKAVNSFLKKKVKQHVFDGMVSPVYNLGPGSLKWKWAAAIANGDVGGGAQLLSKTGTTANGVSLAGLVRRRKEEALLLSNAIYTNIDAPRLPVKRTLLDDAMADGVLERGECGPSVAKLICDLKVLGLYDGVADDVYGFGTQSAVLEYQRLYSLVVDGKAGPTTLNCIAKSAVLGHRDGVTIESQSVEKPVPISGFLAAILSLFGVKK